MYNLFAFGIIDGCFLSSMLAWAILAGMVGYRWGWLGLVIGISTAILAPAVSLLTIMVIGSVLQFFGIMEPLESELQRKEGAASGDLKENKE